MPRYSADSRYPIIRGLLVYVMECQAAATRPDIRNYAVNLREEKKEWAEGGSHRWSSRGRVCGSVRSWGKRIIHERMAEKVRYSILDRTNRTKHAHVARLSIEIDLYQAAG